MQITILDKDFQNVGVIKNGNPYTPSFFADIWHRYLAEGASTFDFTVNKYIAGELQDYCRHINEKAYFHFRYEGKDYLFYVMTITEDDFVIQLSCNSLNLELQNEYANPFTSTSAQSFEWYFKQMEFYFAELELGINEVSDAKLTLAFESQETKLERLRSLLNKFDAEFEFVTKLNDDYSFDKLILNVYKARDDNHQGVGKIRSDISLHYGKNIRGVQRVIDKTQLFNAGKFTGADGLTIKDIERSDKNKNGVEEFYTRKGNVMAYAPLSMVDYPSHTRKNGVDQWTRKDFQTEYTNVNELVAYAFRTLKKYAYPIVTYTINAFSNWLDISAVNLGDTVMIHDKNFVGGINLSARVIEQVISFSNPKNNQLTFSNVVQLESELSQGIRERLKQMVEDAQPYVMTIATDTGVNFKNNKGQSVVSPTLTKGNKTIDCGWRYVVDGVIKSTSPTYIVRGSDVSDKLVLTIGAWVGNQEVAREQVTFTNVNDGAKGSDGKPITVAKAEKQADGVKVTFSDNKSIVVPKGDKGDKGDPADPVPLNALQEEMKQTKQGLSDVKADLLKEKAESSANIEQVKKEVGAISSQQTAYEQSNEQNLARITQQMGDKASKTEVKQTADGIREEISQIVVGGRNLLKGSKGEFKPDSKPTDFDNQVLYVQSTSIDLVKGEKYLISAKTDGVFSNNHNGTQESDNVVLWLMDKTVTNYQIVSDSNTGTTGTVFTWNKPTGTYHLRVNTYHKDARKKVWEVKVEQGTIKTDWSPAPEDIDEQITVAKTTFERTAEGLKTDMVAVKSYAANDGKRKEELEKYSREETAKQIAAERIKTAENYVGKIQYTEDVKGVNRRFEELRTGTSNLLLNTEFKTLADVNNVNGATLKLNQNDYNSHNSIEVTVTGQNKDVWEGITLNASVSAFKKGDTIAVRMPIYIFSDVPINAGLTLVLKNHPKNIGYVFKDLGDLPQSKWHIVEFLHTFDNDANFEGVNFFYLYTTQNGHYKIAEPSLTLSNVIPSSWAPAVEDSKNYTDTKLAEYKQGVDGQLAAVKQEVGSKVSQTTFDQRANQITQSVQELNNNTVKKNQIKIDENGLVSSSEKTVNGQTLASMISQNPEWVEIIAKLLKIKADMIVNGAITADKLNVEKLSALASDLGKVTAGLIDLRKHWVRTSINDVWGIIHDVTYDTSTLLTDSGVITNGRPGRNKKSDVKPTIMPLVWLNSGQLLFANVDSGHDIIQMLINGVYPYIRSNAARIYFGKLEDERDALVIDCEFSELYLKANNYTDWKQSTFNSGVRWKVQGNLVLVDYDVTFNKDGNQAICGIPQEYVAGARMFVVKAWSLNKDKDRTAQLNADGSLHILGAEKGMNYRGQIIWTY